MSQADVIRQGDIKKRRLARSMAQAEAKTALRFLINTATAAFGKPVEEINTAELTAHLEQLVAKQEEIKQLDAEINDLER
jgi:hypothetical protein